MSYKVLKGYKANISNVVEIEKLLRDLKEKLLARAKEECLLLLAREIESLHDDIAMNKVQRPQSIYQAALETLDMKIKNASLKQLPIEYNLNISVNILMNEDFVFFKVNSNNFIYDEAFKKFPVLEEYCVSDIDIMYNNDTKSKRWTDLIKNYEEFQPMGITLISGREDFYSDIQLSDLQFIKASNRLEIHTRREITTRLVNMYSGGGQINPIKLMEYIDMSLLRLESEEVMEEYNEIRKGLKPLIIEIDVNSIV